MPTAIVLPDTDIPWQHICTHWTGWHKDNGDALACRLSMHSTYVLDRFNDYWNDFIERESEEDGTTPPEGIYTDLKEVGYPSLRIMLKSHRRLFASVIMQGLQTEFAGYILRSPREVEGSAPSYFLTRMSSVAVVDEYVVLVGKCVSFRNP